MVTQSEAHVIHRKRTPRPPWLNDLCQIPAAVIADALGSSSVIDPGIRAFMPGVPLCGLALTVQCAYGDNLMLHKGVSMAAPGDVIVVGMEATEAEALPYALVGEILAYNALRRGATGMVLDALIRDVEAIAELNFPMYARGVCIRGPAKKTLGTINHEVHIGGVLISPGDVIIGDRDGVVCVPRAQGEAVLVRAQERLQLENIWKEEIGRGRSTLEFLGFDSKLEELGLKEARQE